MSPKLQVLSLSLSLKGRFNRGRGGGRSTDQGCTVLRSPLLTSTLEKVNSHQLIVLLMPPTVWSNTFMGNIRGEREKKDRGRQKRTGGGEKGQGERVTSYQNQWSISKKIAYIPWRWQHRTYPDGGLLSLREGKLLNLIKIPHTDELEIERTGKALHSP